MTEHPLILRPADVRAIVDGHKATLRVPIPENLHLEALDGAPLEAWSIHRYLKGGKPMVRCTVVSPFTKYPHGNVWVKEAAYIAPPKFGDKMHENREDPQGRGRVVTWSASMSGDSKRCAEDYGVKEMPSVFLPRWAARLFLHNLSHRIERVQDIDEDGAKAEGMRQFKCDAYWQGARHPIKGVPRSMVTAREAFADKWDERHGAGSWKANGPVWVVSFDKVVVP